MRQYVPPLVLLPSSSSVPPEPSPEAAMHDWYSPDTASHLTHVEAMGGRLHTLGEQPPGRPEMPPRSVRMPPAVHPCPQARGVALLVRTASTPSRSGHADRWVPLRGGSPHDRRCAAPLC